MLFRTPTVGQDRPSTDEPDPNVAASTKAGTLRSDPLAASLTWLAAHHGRAVSREALLGGLPILDGRLSVALYDRAARRAGLETEAVKRGIADIPAMVLPAVLIMKDGTALILVGIDTKNQSVKILDPTSDPSTPRIAGVEHWLRTIPAMPFWSGPPPKPMRAPSLREICRGIIGSGRSSKRTGAVTVTLRWPPCWSTCSRSRRRCSR